MGGWGGGTIIAVRGLEMSKFKIGGEDILEGYRSQLEIIYEADGADSAKAYLESIMSAANRRPELYKELLPAILRLRITKKILKEVGNDYRTGEIPTRSCARV